MTLAPSERCGPRRRARVRDRRVGADRHAPGPGRCPGRAERCPSRGRRDRGERPVAAPCGPHPAGTAHHRRRRELVVDPSIDVVVELIGGLEPTDGAGPGGPRSRQAGGHRQQGAAGLTRGGGAADAGQGEGGGPALRGGGGRRHPPGAGPARVADRRADPPGDGHRQRDDQLHPDQDERRGRRLRRRPGRGPGPGLRRA